MQIKNYPSVILSVFFVCGIISSKFFILPSYFLFVSVFFLFVIVISFFIKNDVSRQINYVSIVILFFLFGNLWLQINSQNNSLLSNDISILKNSFVIGEIEDIELPSKDKLNFIVNNATVEYRNKKFDNLKFIVRIKDKSSKKKEKLLNKLNIGNKVIINGRFIKAQGMRNPGQFDYNNYLRTAGISGFFDVYKTEDLKILNNNKNIFRQSIWQARLSINNRINELYSNLTAGLLKGLLLADRQEIDYKTKALFVNSGVIHVLAVSGLHVGYIILILMLFFERFNLYVKLIAVMLGLIVFAFITGLPDSVVRASIMAIVIILAKLTNRTTNIFNSLSIAALIILLINPQELFNPGFQLSFSAVLSIAILYPIISKPINKYFDALPILKYIFLFIAVSLSAQIGTLPFTLYYFGKLSLIALAANLIVIPLIGIIIALAITSLFISILSVPVALYFAAANELFTEMMFNIVKLAGEFKYSFLFVKYFSLLDGFLFYAFLSLLIYFWLIFKNGKAKVLLIILILLNYFLFGSFDDIELLKPKHLNVVMIDIGQGDSFLLKFPNGKTALIDAGLAKPGFDSGERIIKPLLEELDIDKINYAFVSHLDKDHSGGFLYLLKNNIIEKLYKPVSDSSETDLKFESFVLKNNVSLKHYKKEKIIIDHTAIYFLCDSSIQYNFKLSKNNRSGILKIVYGNISILFTGDMEKQIEQYLLSRYSSFLHSDILKVSHHGSKTGSTDEFLNAVNPNLALISVGKNNPYKHPSDEVIERLKSRKVKIIRSDINAAFILSIDGSKIDSVSWKNYY